MVYQGAVKQKQKISQKNIRPSIASISTIIALSTSVLLILLGQANAWYSNNPENNLVKDIKRKVAIAILLLIPNTAALGSGLLIALTIFTKQDSLPFWSGNTLFLGIGLLVSFGFFSIYWVCLFYSLPFCSSRTLSMFMLIIYIFVF